MTVTRRTAKAKPQDKPVSQSEPMVLGLDGYKSLIGLWCLRLLVIAKGHKFFITKRGFSDDDILNAIGLGAYVDKEPKPRVAHKLIKEQFERASQRLMRSSGQLQKNLAQLAEVLSLSVVDQKVLTFLCLLEQSVGLDQALCLFCGSNGGNQQRSLTVSLIAVALGIKRDEINKALSSRSTLIQCGLVKQTEGRFDNSSQLSLMRELAGMLTYEKFEAESFLGSFCEASKAAKLSPHDFTHLESHYLQLRKYLKVTIARKTAGVNILLYGEPGSGKTEMVRVLAEDLAFELYDVKNADPEGDPLSGSDRFSGYRICQRTLHSSDQSMVLFDEIEDAFSGGLFGPKKAWINEMLETNAKPTFWVSNNITMMDLAFIRRFDITLKMPKLTKEARKRIAIERLKGLSVSEGWLDTLAGRNEIQPAHLANAAKVVQHLGYRNSSRIESELDSVLGGLYQALGVGLAEKRGLKTETIFDPTLSNTDYPLAALASGLKRSQTGRICLYGPPGTGKTGMAHYLADYLGKPLVEKTASTLLDMYLGGTEKNIASAFEEARDTDSILLIDEADSFLQNRAGASHSWEVSQVNELLVQMERFDGIFVASTNFMGSLDTASLRRFDIKIRFDYMNPVQRWGLFCSTLATPVKQAKQHQTAIPINVPEGFRQPLGLLRCVTPGDYSTVLRRHRVLAEKLTPDSLLQGLRKEHAVKMEREGRGIGFVV